MVSSIVRAQGPAGSRDIPLQDFFASLFQNSLDANELVTGLLLPVLPAKTSSAFFKLETNANDLAIVNAAARISLDDSGNCTTVRVVIGGGGAETPVRATSCENLLQGKQLSADVLDQAAAAVPADLQPMSDHRASGAYRAAMSKTLARRALARAVQRQEA
jgi:CO/xanthine dehydrogenase FAD-binding subunit